MEELEGFANQYKELLKKVENIEEVGCLDLINITKELTSLKSRAEISANSFTHDTANNLKDVRTLLNSWYELDNEIDNIIDEVNLHYQSKWQLVQAKFAEYRRIKEYRKENLDRINMYKLELDKHTVYLNHTIDDFAKSNIEDTIKDDEKHIRKAEEANRRFEKELYEYSVLIRTLLEGGKVPEFEIVDEEDMLEEIERDNNKILEEKEEKKETKPKKKDEAKVVAPKKVTTKREEEDEEPELNMFLPIEDEEEEDKKSHPNKFKDVDKTKKAGLVAPLPEDLEEDEEEALTPPEPEEEDEDDIIVDLDEEEEPVPATVKQPKEALWKKIGKVIVKATAFLSLVATAVHTGLIADRMGKKENVEKPKEETVEQTESEQKEETKDTSKTEEPAKEEPKKEETTVADNDTKKEEPKQEEKKEEPKKEEEPAKETEMPIKLNPGETVYNTDTGVEVGYDGSAAHQDANGKVTEEKDRDLTYENGQAVVNDKDLDRGEEKTTFPIENERTGLEVSEEEAKAKMTDEERAVAESQEEEWFRMLEESGLSR